MSKFFRCPQPLFSFSQITRPKAQPPDSEDIQKGRQPAFGHEVDNHKSRGKSCKLDGSLIVAGRRSGQLLRRTWDRCFDLRGKPSMIYMQVNFLCRQRCVGHGTYQGDRLCVGSFESRKLIMFTAAWGRKKKVKKVVMMVH